MARRSSSGASGDMAGDAPGEPGLDPDASGHADYADSGAYAGAVAPPQPARLVRVLHGPNLNLLGARDPEVYGDATLAEIEQLAASRAAQLGLVAEFLQTNHEGTLVDAVQAAGYEAQGIIINPGALTHYSRALADAIAAVNVPVIEVHLSNIHAREEWRRTSVVSPYATAVIAGFHSMGYVFAMDAMTGFLNAYAAA